MAKTLKRYLVVLDGIDKTGKDTIGKYLWQLDHRLNILCRGWPSLTAYSKKFNRDVEYALPDKNAVFVHLTAEFDDWSIRCKMTNEPYINYADDRQLFNDAFKTLIMNGYTVLTYNTTYLTAFEIASDIIETINKLNEED